MSSVEEHYRRLLAQHYVWMFGIPFEQKVAEQKALLDRVVLLPSALCGGLAIDLGSGPGFQAIALAELGFTPVIAVDTSKELLAELRDRRGSHAIEISEADVTSLASMGGNGDVSVIVCMGDTLPHLPSKTAVRELFRVVYEKLATGGVFVLTFRDLSKELYGPTVSCRCTQTTAGS